MFLTFSQANGICRDYKHLIGGQVKNNWRTIGFIESLVVAPFDDLSKHRFIRLFRENKNAEIAREFYKGELFDVLIIARSSLNASETLVIDFRKYVKEQGIPFNYDFYVSRTLLMETH